MAMDEHQLFETALAATMNKLDFAFYLKEEQKTALESFLGKKEVFAVLPAGYGKSLIYQLAPLVAQQRDQLLQSQKIIFPKALPQLRTHTAVNVILDADSAHQRLIVSHEGKQVRDGGGWKEGNNRFSHYLGVLGKDGFSSGSFYFEVQVKDQTEWYLGVARESVNRKSRIMSLSPDEGYWTVSLYNGKYWARDSPSVPLSLTVEPERIGVFVDYDQGLVSFYDVESMSHIYSYTHQSFNEKLYPFVCLGWSWNNNSTPLIICDDY